MTHTEAALQLGLDLNRRHSDLRGVLADHLEDMGDPRAEGYRALGRLGVWPHATPPGLRRVMSDAYPGFHGGPSLIWGEATCWMRKDEWLVRPPATRPIIIERDERNKAVWITDPPWCRLPRDWFIALWSDTGDSEEVLMPWVISDTRQKVEDLVALRLQVLPDYRRRELATGQPPGTKKCPHCTGGVFATVDWPEKMKPRLGSEPSEIACHTCNGKGELPCL